MVQAIIVPVLILALLLLHIDVARSFRFSRHRHVSRHHRGQGHENGHSGAPLAQQPHWQAPGCWPRANHITLAMTGTIPPFLEIKDGLKFSNEDYLQQRPPGTPPLVSIGSQRVMPPLSDSEARSDVENKRWRMWFHARDASLAEDVADKSTGRVYYATSDNCIDNWSLASDNAVAIRTGKELGDWWWFDSEHVGVGDVLKPGGSAQDKFVSSGGMFIMYTFGGNTDQRSGGNVKGLKLEIGVAVSQDGQYWSKVEGPSAYGSVLEVGAANQFDAEFVGWPCVVESGFQYFLYYHTYSKEAQRYVVGLATATDGVLKWVKRGQIFTGGSKPDDFDGGGVTRRHVVKLPNGSFRMWYEGVSKAGIHSIGLAVSDNGVVWDRYSDEPVFAPSDDPTAWDSSAVGSPHVVWLPEVKRWRLYYTGRSLQHNAGGFDGFSGIGIAESVDEEGFLFKRIQ